METRAVARYIWIAPRKVRLVADLVRGKGVNAALAILRFAPQGAAQPVSKVVRSAQANAEHNHNLNADELFIKAICIDEGPTLKRFRPGPEGGLM